MVNKYILSICLGLVAGFFGGALGVSGAELVLPGLVVLGIEKDYKTSIGTTLVTILPPLSIFAVYEYYKRKQVDFKIGVTLIIAILISSWFGSKIVANMPNYILEYATGFYLISIGLFFLLNAHFDLYGINK